MNSTCFKSYTISCNDEQFDVLTHNQKTKMERKKLKLKNNQFCSIVYSECREQWHTAHVLYIPLMYA